jgi:hypothetical protein
VLGFREGLKFEFRVSTFVSICSLYGGAEMLTPVKKAPNSAVPPGMRAIIPDTPEGRERTRGVTRVGKHAGVKEVVRGESEAAWEGRKQTSNGVSLYDIDGAHRTAFGLGDRQI